MLTARTRFVLQSTGEEVMVPLSLDNVQWTKNMDISFTDEDDNQTSYKVKDVVLTLDRKYPDDTSDSSPPHAEWESWESITWVVTVST